MEVEPFTKGSTVEVSSDEEGFHGSWYVATLVDIVDASPTKTRGSNKRNRDKKNVGYLVRYAKLFQEDNLNEQLTEVVHPSYVRPLPPRNIRRDDDNLLTVAEAETEEGNGGDFQLYDVVDAYLRDGWWIGVVRKVMVDGEMKKYVISFESPSENIEFEGSKVRYHVDWINSRWKFRPQKVPNIQTNCRSRRVVNSDEEVDLLENFRHCARVENSGRKGDTVMETNGAKAKHQDSVLLKKETIFKDGNSQLKRKRGRSKRPNGSLEDEVPMSAVVNESQTTENHHILPFVKQSPVWATLESLEVYQNLTQNPHFAPLWESKEDHREGLAIAHMVTFANVVQRTTTLQWTDPTNIINNSLETLLELEANGFNVGPVRARLDELLAKKRQVGRLEGERKEAEKEVEKYNSEKTAIDEEINGLERMMREVEEKMAHAVAMKKVKDEEIMVVQKKLKVVDKTIVDWKVGFEELVGSPL
ncbi:hypothetical protein LXL04_034288 [Taraxacum kok-saghyz]